MRRGEKQQEQGEEQGATRSHKAREWERGSQTNKVYSGPLTSQERKRYGAAVGMEKKQHDAHWG